jgi:hypothetical protein
MIDLKYRPSMRGMRIDFTEIATVVLAHDNVLVPAWIPDGRRQGREWIARNPKRADKHCGSFCVNLTTGKWADFAVAGAKGGDLISLRAYLDGVSQSEAARRVAMEVGYGAL